MDKRLVPKVPGSSTKSELQHVEIDVLSARGIYRVTKIFAGFVGKKASLVDSIGFGGSRLLGERSTLDGQLSLWLLGSVDTSTMTIKSPGDQPSLPMKPRDVHLVLGLPYQGVEVDDGSNVSEATMSAVREKLFLKNTGGMITVDYLEDILVNDYNDDMSAAEEEAFKIAAVLYLRVACMLSKARTLMSRLVC
ncbi:hypothetical protein BRADI_3g58231v3 [Brachypodium distachyon]|uniref:Uncharacterized protein n=1 Tax=Brachypodium distachyon TaxID=15368 RepID=A0A2K2D5N9_BRADI|nr:hypothetical protein BRADI_3g58231v3 [Brachypodium distachyon]PNT69587.1 hypothetical protein BRADI_3g58231v3 [Brachypodium distachyon]